jgi:hypothetical protein
VSVKTVTGVRTVTEGAVKAAVAPAGSSGRGIDLRQGDTEEDSRRRGDEFS